MGRINKPSVVVVVVEVGDVVVVGKVVDAVVLV